MHKEEEVGDEKLISRVLKSFDKADSASKMVTATLDEMATATTTQTRTIEEVAKGVQDISSAVQNTATSVNSAMQKTTSSNEAIQQAAKEAQLGMEKMNILKERVSKSFDEIAILGSELKKIYSMVNLITKIADQTSLLALNAAIEAARAGDSGKGFAVVADEVKRLADSSMKGADDISGTVKNLEKVAATTMQHIEQGNVSLAESYEVITKVLSSLDKVAQMVAGITASMHEISSAAEEAASGSEEVAESGEEVASVSQENLRQIDRLRELKRNETSTILDASDAARTLAKITGIMDQANIISMTDLDGNITYMNDKFLEVAHFASSELMGQSHRLLKSGFHSPLLFEALWKSVTAGKTFTGYVRNRSKDGSIYWVKATINPIRDGDGRITGYVSVRAPVTELMVMF
ncbi:methyl-accepting chemotaxis protein, partial [Nitrososphaera sp.]|uniref:methyl-accepting chemotaxis protein n=1 Tax=Nitrososphaera sp. TaxID=1971748 RepID=UPI00307D4832